MPGQASAARVAAPARPCTISSTTSSGRLINFFMMEPMYTRARRTRGPYCGKMGPTEEESWLTTPDVNSSRPLAAGALASAGNLALKAERQTATDWVTLGKSNVKVTRLAFGTGPCSGQVQRDLGQEQFTRLVRHAYERGIRFFETAESLRRDARDAGRSRCRVFRATAIG